MAIFHASGQADSLLASGTTSVLGRVRACHGYAQTKPRRQIRRKHQLSMNAEIRAFFGLPGAPEQPVYAYGLSELVPNVEVPGQTMGFPHI